MSFIIYLFIYLKHGCLTKLKKGHALYKRTIFIKIAKNTAMMVLNMAQYIMILTTQSKI